MNDIDNIELSLVIPVYNEAKSLEVFLPIIDALLTCKCELLVVYDSMEDNSVPVVSSAEQELSSVRGILNKYGRGVSRAWRTGIEEANGQYVLIITADEIGPLMIIEDCLMLMKEGCDYISVTRYAHGGRRFGGSKIGGLLSRTANRLFRTAAGCAFTDATTGMKGFRRELYPQFTLTDETVGWEIAFETAIQAQAMGWKLGEIPVTSADRQYGGKSTFRLIPWVNAYMKQFLKGVRVLRGSSTRTPAHETVIKIPDAINDPV